MGRQLRVCAAGMAAGLLVAMAACREEEGKPSGNLDVSRYNVLLITLDTTRADVLACYGNPVVKTPNLDRLAREGVRFTQCTAAAPITLPSHVSILTGTYPFVHGVRNNGRYVPDEGIVTLAEWLSDRKFTTGAEVAAFVLDAMWGLDQGFASYQSARPDESREEQWTRLTGHQSVPANDVADRAIAWLGRHHQDCFFLWVHFFDPHQPWRPPEPFATQYSNPYVGEIAFMDEQIGRVLDELRRLKRDRTTLVAVVGDHGEGLGQHEEITHLYYVYDSTLRVPLIFWGPGVVPAGRVVDAQVRTVDVAPTVLDWLGLDPLPTVQGVSLRPLVEGRSADPGLAAYAESMEPFESHGFASLRALRADGWKYIHAPRPELYDVRRDPGERVNLAGQEPERLKTMRERLTAVVTEGVEHAVSAAATRVLDADAADRLSALGYVGGYAPPGEADELTRLGRFEGPDPKDHIGMVNEFLKAQAYIEAGQPEEGERILQVLIAQEPHNPALRSVLARMYWKTGQFPEAAEQYATLLTLQPENAPEHYRAGRVFGELGQWDKAEAHLRTAAKSMPAFADAHAYLAFVLAAQGRTQEARDGYEKALALDPGNEAGGMGFSALLLASGDRAVAIRVLRDALERNPDSAQLANNAAWQLATAPDATLRDGAEAVRLAEHARDLMGDPNADVLDTLGAAYAEAGRMEEASAAARRAVEFAEQQANTRLAEAVRARLALYEAGKPYHEGG